MRSLRTEPWIWSWIATLLVWLAIVAFTEGRGGGEVLTAALAFATFTVIVGLGQMMVITLGPGNVDLSIPGTIALAGCAAMKITDGDNSLLLPGVLAALAIGVAVGVFNYGLIRLLRIPPIIATLSTSFAVQSAAIAYGRGIRIKPAPMLADFATARIAGVPVLAIAIALLSVAIGIVLARTRYGRSVVAIGQNMRAAHLAGLSVDRVRFATYVLSAVLASLTGVVLSGFSGGAALDMGNEYLLASIAVVVIGGTSVAGGRANVPGIWGAALFLYLLVTMLNTFGASAGLRSILTGVIIIGVILAAGGDEEPQRS